LVNKPKIFCIIPARTGSKRIKNKNIVKIKGKELILYSLESAIKCKKIEKIFVSTNSKIITNICSKYKDSRLKIISRSKKSETDTASTEILLNEFLKKHHCDILILLQATNIFIKQKDLSDAIDKFIKDKYDSMLSVVKSDRFFWEDKKKNFYPINYNPKKRPRSQNINNFYVENGSFYIFFTNKFKKEKSRLFKKIGFYEMEKKAYFEIDNKEDLNIVKKII
jgi:N-acylneuraminate cytidylyltransferase